MRLNTTTLTRMHQQPETLKHVADTVAVSASGFAFFSDIPWAAIAAFLSTLWLLTRLYEYIREKLKK